MYKGIVGALGALFGIVFFVLPFYFWHNFRKRLIQASKNNEKITKSSLVIYIVLCYYVLTIFVSPFLLLLLFMINADKVDEYSWSIFVAAPLLVTFYVIYVYKKYHQLIKDNM